uniref:Uncharacterized protein n=1 Tax=Zea mays TaxID=4577 RepID=C4J4L3_MAIZE|nr:unknown [Zea mays]ACR36185.1 unknown [Zea mays]
MTWTAPAKAATPRSRSFLRRSRRGLPSPPRPRRQLMA